MKEIRKLKALSACDEAVDWLKTQNSFTQAWKKCQRGDWMLWLLRKTLDLSDESQLRKLTLAKAKCAKLVIHLMKDQRSRKAVEVAESFGNGNATREELDAAAYAAYDAAAAYAAAAADAADAAAAAAAYAADAAADADDAAAKQSILQQCADKVREVFPDAPAL